MDYSRTYHLYLEGLFTDLELNLVDGSECLTLNVHKIVLIAHSEYFEKLLTFNKLSSKFTLNIPDVQATRSIILSFYGQEITRSNDWSYLLSLAKCHDYFGLEMIMPILPLEIDAKDYDTILELYGIIGFDEDSMKILTNNLPLDYDLSKLSKELVTKMIESGTLHVVTATEGSCIKLLNIFTGELVHILRHREVISDMYYSKDMKFFATIDTTNCLNIWSAFDTSIVYKDRGVVAIDFSCSYVHLAMAYKNYSIKIYDLVQNKIIICFAEPSQHTNKITFLKFSFNGLFLASSSLDQNLKIWDVTKGHLLYNIETASEIKSINFSKDTSFVTISTTENVQKAWKIHTCANALIFNMEPIEMLSISNHKHRYWEMSTNEVCIAVKYNNGVNIINAKTNILINFFDEVAESRILFSPNYKYIAFVNKASTDLFVVATGVKLHTFNALSASFSSDNKYLALGKNHQLQIFNIIDGIYYEHPVDKKNIIGAGFVRKNDMLIYETMDNDIMLFNMATRQVINTISAKLHYTDATIIYNRTALRLLEIIE